MNCNEQKFWEEYKKELVDPIDILIKNQQDSAACKLIISGIDSLAGFYAGRTEAGLVKETFLNFVEKYLPRFNSVKFTGKKLINFKTEKEIKKPSEILYFMFRNGLIHDSTLGIGTEIYRDTDISVLWTGSYIQIFRINILGFFEYYKQAIKEYEKDLSADEALKKNFSTKYNVAVGFSFGYYDDEDIFITP
jgi:hypothetical protein